MDTCQYCGAEVAAPGNKTCQSCNLVIAQANCDGVIKQVMDTAESMKSRADLPVEARQAAIEEAYTTAVGH